MDPSSYPPPPAPPEQYTAPAPPSPDYSPQGAVTPEKKKNKTLVIVLAIVGVLLLCCCGSVIAGVTIFKDTTEEITGDLGDFNIDDGGEATDDDTTGGNEITGGSTGGQAEWDEFQPELVDASIYGDPSSADMALVEEIHAELYPDFDIDDVVLEAGGETTDSYFPNILYVKASLPSDPAVRIAYYFWADAPDAVSAGYVLTEDQTETYETLAQSSTGINYIYDHENLMGLIGGVSEDDLVDVLAQADQDFPDYVAMMTAMDGDTAHLVITRWEAFYDLSEGLEITYERDGDSWTVTDIAPW